MTVEIKELDEFVNRVNAAIDRISVFYEKPKRFYNLRESWEMKGGMAYSTVLHDPWFQPKGGKEDTTMNNNRVWTRESIEEWLSVSDAELPAYHAKYKTGQRSPRQRKLEGNRY